MNSTVQTLRRRLNRARLPLPKYGADGIRGDELWNTMNQALDTLYPGAPPDPVEKTTSPAGRAKISAREGNGLNAYRDSVGILTMGVGHTSAAGEPKVVEGLIITPRQSDEILSRDLKDVEATVNDLVKVAVSQNQFDVLVSLVFNIGSTAFKNSILLKLLNEGNLGGAADQFLVWSKAGGNVLQGLVNRRQDERVQFLS